MAVFWVVAPCSLIEVYQRFRGTCCLHPQGDDRLQFVVCPHHIESACYKMLHRTDFLDRKMDIKFGTWKVSVVEVL
jgi:hypothetical protein